ncbi:MAG TPA: ABC transporter substrate-binding protein [Actinomycetes bacterium]|jgi:peptide/nickel transport system substrate-binding protein|nr:ABC transporter substrate-binding protein [Actinomycetes bacterium]
MRRRARAVLLALALFVAGCQATVSNPPPDDSAKGVRHGTLRVLNQADVEALDPGMAYAAADLALLRGMTRELYSFDVARKGEQALEPVPDLADGPYQLSRDRRTYTFQIRLGVRYAQPVSREIRAQDFIYAIRRQFQPGQKRRSPNPYAGLIKGVAEFAAGKAKTISGMQALDDRTLRITLNQPASDFPSILTLPFFSPVPEEYASRYELGQEYARHMVGSGPYTLKSYAPGKLIELVRNVNWDPQSDPLRRAWVDRVSVTIGGSEAEIQEAIEQGEADLNLDLVSPPNQDLRRLSGDPDLKPRFALMTTGCVRYLSLQTDSPPTSNPLVRRAINLAVDKRALLLEIGGSFAGDVATTILSPTLSGFQRYADPYATPDYRGDPLQARRLLEQAGYPNGVTINYVGPSTGKGPQIQANLQSALERAGISLRTKSYDGYKVYTDSLHLRSKKDEHQIGLARWCPDFPGNGARSFIGVLLDGRKITPTANNNYGDYNNPQVNSMIDEAYRTGDPQRRNALWGEIDRRIMQDAAWVPLVYERQPYFWSSRVMHWTFSPWISNPDITNMWLDPNTP